MKGNNIEGWKSPWIGTRLRLKSACRYLGSSAASEVSFGNRYASSMPNYFGMALTVILS